jgi:ribose transport system permease protein
LNIKAFKKILVSKRQSYILFFERLTPFFSLVIMFLILGFLSPYFFTLNNLLTIGIQVSVIAIMAIGQTFVIIAAGIDLSVGSVLALSGIISAILMRGGCPISLAIIAGVGTGSFCGFINGFIITRGKIAPFIITLGMMGIARGLALIITGGNPVFGLPENFSFLGNGKIFGIPVPIIIMSFVVVVAYLFLSRHILGRYTYAIGSNVEAARLSGININRYNSAVYVISGTLAGIAGVLLTSRLVTGQPTAGTGYELDTIAAVVIGGASLMGGQGTIIGTIIGAFIMATLRNGCNLLNISAFWQLIIIGAVIILAVYYDQVRRRHSATLGG